MPIDRNRAEAFVAEHSEGTFLSLWGLANPLGKDAGKELCDYIVVCGPDVVIFSVKDIGLSGEPTRVELERWRRKAIKELAAQVYGAERFLARQDVVRGQGERTLRLPQKETRRIHRVCVAFGSNGRAGLQMGDLGKGFVHVFDEASFPILLRELDTITDFTHYLETKRAYFESGRRAVFPGEEHLLAIYLHHGRSFPDGQDVLVLDDTLWPGFSAKEEYRARKEADRVSYAWDRVIEYVGRDLLANDLLFVDPPTEGEMVLRVLAQECRFHRRFLAETLNEVLLGNQVRARMTQSMSGIGYVVLAADRDQDRQYRIAELTARCTIARAKIPGARTIVGIASERAAPGARGLSFDLFMLDKPELTDEEAKEAARLSEGLGYFRSPQVSTRHVEEYPAPSNDLGRGSA